MRTFRLDPDSVRDFVTSWPLVLACTAVGSAIAMLATTHHWGRILIPVLFGIALGPRLVDGQLREKYPTAKHLWLLSIGLMTSLIGIIARMAFPGWQGTGFDLTWLGTAFFSILAFVLVNHRNKDVVQ